MNAPQPQISLRVVIQRLRRHESRGVPEVDLWMAGPSSVFRRITGILDTGCPTTLLTVDTAGLLQLPRLRNEPSVQRTAWGRVAVVPSRVLVRFAARETPPLVVLLPVSFPLREGAPTLDINLFGADLCNVFSVSTDRNAVSFSAY